MKKTVIALSFVLTVVLLLSVTKFKDTGTVYATVAYSTEGKAIYIYYGGQVKEEVAIKKGDNPNDKILDVLNDLSKKGYEVVTSNTHAFNLNVNKDQTILSYVGNYIEFYYTLKKTN